MNFEHNKFFYAIIIDMGTNERRVKVSEGVIQQYKVK